MVKHFTYDAYGRLVRVQSPWPDPSFESEGSLRSERFYYDGVRRIQEVYIDPIMAMSMAMQGEGGGQLQATAQQIDSENQGELDQSATPAALESEQMESQGQSQIPTTQTYLSREYVWGPGDWGVDEIVAQYDEDRRVSFPLQDASGDVIALCDLGGASGAARVVTELVYDAYGQVLAREDLAGTTPADLRLGHKGLFFDRLDGGVADPMTGQDTRRLEAGSTLLGYNRNRSLHTQWGRFLQKDPIATGLCVQEAMVFDGESMQCRAQEVDIMKHLVDGPNAYAYVRHVPLTGEDPAGLFFSFADILGGSTWQAELQETSADYLQDAHKTFKGHAQRVFGNIALFQMADAQWAQDWNARDDDYSVLGDIDYYYGDSVYEARSRGILLFGSLSTIEEMMIHTAARVGNHGKPKHYMAMADEAIRFINSRGLDLRYVDVVFNAAPRGAGVRKRPDVLIYDKLGHLMHVAEVANTQTGKSLRNRVRYWRNLFPGRVRGVKL